MRSQRCAARKIARSRPWLGRAGDTLCSQKRASGGGRAGTRSFSTLRRSRLAWRARQADSSENVIDLLRAAVSEWRPNVVLLPAGLGLHRDHLIVRAAGQQLCEEKTGVRFVWYEDLPYANELTDLQILDHMCGVDVTLQPVCLPLDPAAIESRRRGLEIYVSQVDDEVLGRLRASVYRRGGTALRVWSREFATELTKVQT